MRSWPWWVVVRLGAALAVAGGLALYGPPRGTAEAARTTVPLAPGVSELVLAEDGSRAVVATVTFDRGRGVPERRVVAVDGRTGRVLWGASLPAVSCCDFPVFAATPDARWMVVGGAGRVEVFRSDGQRVEELSLGPAGSLSSAVQIMRGGRTVLVGQVEGRVTAFRLDLLQVAWRRDVRSVLLGLALNEERREVLAVTADGFVGLDSASGTVRSQLPVGGVPVAAAVPAGSGFTVTWKGTSEVLAVGRLEAGRWRWRRRLGVVTVPLLQVDRSGDWIGVSDLLGRGAWVLDRGGRAVWSARKAPVAVGVDPEGRVVVAEGKVVEVRAPGPGRVQTQVRLPGRAHVVRLRARVLAVLGSEDRQSVLPDRLWLWRVPP